MDLQELQMLNDEVRKKESVLDGECIHEIRIGAMHKYLMERFMLIRYVGMTGKTRIVIEYNNDTGKGWMRVVTEDPVTIPIHECQLEHPQHPSDCPTGCSRCVEDIHHQQRRQQIDMAQNTHH